MNTRRLLGRLLITTAVTLVGCHAQGCADHGRQAVPSKATRLATGDGREVLRATAPRGGTMYVLDRTEDRLLWSGAVREGDVVVLDAEAGLIQKNGKTVTEPKIRREHRFEVSFDRPPRPL